MIVKATREGLVGQRTSSGWKINIIVPFVALPSEASLRLWIVVKNPLNGRSIKALVLDTGPWNIEDDNYVFHGARPQAESGTDLFGHKTNLAGIDLGQYVWNYLQMDKFPSGQVDWSFL